MTRQIFLDTETTGLSPATGDKIIEIGCVEYVARKPTGNNWHHYINPERLSNPEALAVHGISDESLVGKPLFKDLAADFLRYIDGAQVIIHNAPFDVGFLDAELAHAGLAPFKRAVSGVLDSLVMAKQQWPGRRNGLDALCDRLDVDNSGRVLHGALLDAQLLAEVYLAMTRGQDSLAIDEHRELRAGHATTRVDLTQLSLAVHLADDDELAVHEALLVDLDKASNHRTHWYLYNPRPIAFGVDAVDDATPARGATSADERNEPDIFAVDVTHAPDDLWTDALPNVA